MKKGKEWLKNEMLNLRNASNRVMVVAIGEVMELIDQLEEPEKVIIPQFVADHIAISKEDEDSPRISMGEAHISKELNVWLAKTEDYMTYPNQEKFMRAWLDGYEVEKEKLYWVIIPTKGEDWRYYYLDGFGGIYMTDDLKNVERHTEAFIRSVSDDLWPFAVEVAE